MLKIAECCHAIAGLRKFRRLGTFRSLQRPKHWSHNSRDHSVSSARNNKKNHTSSSDDRNHTVRRNHNKVDDADDDDNDRM